METKQWELQSGLIFNLDVPTTAEEFDSLPGGRVGLVVECAVDDVMYRGPFADVRDQLAEAIEIEYTNVARGTKPHPNKERAAKGETVYAESPGKYIARAAAELNPNAADGEEALIFQPLLDKIMADNAAKPDTDKTKIKFSVEKAARTGTGGLVGKQDLETAGLMIAKGAEKLAKALVNLQSELSRPTAIVLPTEPEAQKKALALLIKEYRGVLAKRGMANLDS